MATANRTVKETMYYAAHPEREGAKSIEQKENKRDRQSLKTHRLYGSSEPKTMRPSNANKGWLLACVQVYRGRLHSSILCMYIDQKVMATIIIVTLSCRRNCFHSVHSTLHIKVPLELSSVDCPAVITDTSTLTVI